MKDRMNKSQIQYVENAIWRHEHRLLSALDRQIEEIREEMQRQRHHLQLEQIRTGLARIKDVPDGYSYVSDIFIFDEPPLEACEQEAKEKIKNLKDKKTEVEREARRIQDMAVLGSPEQACEMLDTYSRREV